MSRAALIILIAAHAASAACASRPQVAGEAPRAEPGAAAGRPAAEYERILGTFAVKSDAAIYLTPRLLERGYDDEDDDAGADALARMIESFRNLGHKRGEAAARLNYGAVLWHRGDGDVAYRQLETAQELFLAAGDLEGEAHAHEWLGYFFRESGEKELAEDHLALAYQMFQRLANETAAERVLSYGE